MVNELSLRDIFYYSSISGFFPFVQERLEFKLSRKKLCLGFIMVLWLAAESVAMSQRSLNSSTLFLLNFFEVIFTVFANTLPTVSFVFTYLNVSYLNNFTRTIDSVDKSLLKIDNSPREGDLVPNRRILAYFTVYMVMLCSDGVCFYSDQFNWRDLFQYQYYYLPMIPIMFEVDLTVSLTSLLGQRFAKIRTSLADDPRAFELFFCEILVDAYDNLADASLYLNAYYGPQIINIFANALWIQVFGCYRIIDFFNNSSDNVARSIFIVNLGCWIILSIMFIWDVASAIHMAVIQANEFNLLLYQRMLEGNTAGLLSNKKLRLHIATKRKIEFIPCGLFIIDYSLLHSMVAAVTTYLVILIQFDKKGTIHTE